MPLKRRLSTWALRTPTFVARSQPHQRLRDVARKVRVLRDALEIGMDVAAERGKRGERHAPPSFEKCAAQLPLECDNGIGQGGLGHATAAGCPRDAALFA